MKLPTSVLPGRNAKAADFSLDVYRDAVQPHIDEPVIAACLFSRQGLMSEKAAGHFGALPYVLARKRSQTRASGLPQHFIVAVTADRVYAFETKIGMKTGTAGEVRGEVARWDRAALHVTSAPEKSTGGLTLKVTIESPGEEEKVQCSVGRHELSEDFLRLLSDPSAKA
jgi:hypothetical protein